MTSTIKLPSIAFMGKAGSGKTTAAQYLVDHFGYDRLSFAAPLKDIAVRLWGQSAMTDRAKLQGLGVAVREIQEDTWVNLALCKLDNWQEQDIWSHQHTRAVVDDMRFPNEYHALRKAGFKFVRVLSDRNQRVARLQANGKLQDEAQLEHVSETALDKHHADHTIYNVGTPDELGHSLRAMVNSWAL